MSWILTSVMLLNHASGTPRTPPSPGEGPFDARKYDGAPSLPRTAAVRFGGGKTFRTPYDTVVAESRAVPAVLPEKP